MSHKFLNRILFAVLVAASSVLFTACNKAEKAPEGAGPMGMTALVSAEQVMMDFPEAMKKYNGIFEAVNTQNVVAQVSGRLMETCVVEGSHVEAGATLFKIEDVVYKANVDSANASIKTCEANITSSTANLASAEANLQQAEAKLRYAVSSYVRYAQLYCGKDCGLEDLVKPIRGPNPTEKTLYKMLDDVGKFVRQMDAPSAAVSKDDFENAETNLKSAIATLESSRAAKDAAQGALESANAALESAKAQLELANINMGYTDVKSLIAGRVGRRSVSTGDYVSSASGALLTVTQMNPIYVRFSMSEQDYSGMFGSLSELQTSADIQIVLQNEKVGETNSVSVKKDENGKNMLFLDNKIHTNMDSVYIWALLDNESESLNPGGICRVIVRKRAAQKSAFVRNTAIQHDRNGSFVFVVGKGNVVERRYVELGPQSTSLQSILPNEDPAKTVNDGDVVVTSGAHKIIMMPGVETKVNLGAPTGLSAEETQMAVMEVTADGQVKFLRDQAIEVQKSPAAGDSTVSPVSAAKKEREIAKVPSSSSKESKGAEK